MVRLVSTLILVGLASAVGIRPDGSCDLISLLPFTGRGENPSDHSVKDVFSHMAATLLAVEHFNERNPAVVSELAYEEFAIGTGCNVTFSNASLVADSASSASAAVLEMLDIQRRRDLDPCAVVGLQDDTAAVSTSVVTSAMGLPLVTHAAFDSAIGRQDLHPLTTRTSVPRRSLARSIVSYIASRGRDYVYVLSTGGSGNQLADDIVSSGSERFVGMTVRSVSAEPPYKGKLHPNSIWNAMKTIKQSTFRTIVLSVHRLSTLEGIADAAAENGMVNEEYVWMFTPLTNVDALLNGGRSPIQMGSNLDRLLRGAASVQLLDAFDVRSATSKIDALTPEDPFMKSWVSQGPRFVNRVNAWNPIKEEGQPGYFRAGRQYFQRRAPQRYAGFIYDAVMSIGMGACRSAKSQTHDIFEGILTANFTGASGPVYFEESQRSSDSVAVGVLNIRPEGGWHDNRNGNVDSRRVRHRNGGQVGEDGDIARYDYEITALLPSMKESESDEPEHIRWWRRTWVTVDTFLFSEGTSDEPQPLRDDPAANYLSTSVRAAGLSLMAVALLLSLGSLLWLFFMRKRSVIKAAQPEFLYIMCIGSAMTSFAILTLSFDESDGFSKEQLDAACTATPWLFVLGYNIVYLSMFSKLWRVKKVLKFRRRKVTITHVIGPFIAVLLTAIAILSAWTAVDPWVWERTLVDESTGETFGHCTSFGDRNFLTPLIVIMIVSTLITAIFAWKTKDLPGDFSDSNLVFYAIFAQLQVWAVGLPVLALIGDDYDTDATYMGRVMLLWTFSVSSVGVIVGPKMWIVGRRALQRRSQLREQSPMPGLRRGITVTGINSPIPTERSFFGSWRRNASNRRNADPERSSTGGTGGNTISVTVDTLPESSESMIRSSASSQHLSGSPQCRNRSHVSGALSGLAEEAGVQQSGSSELKTNDLERKEEEAISKLSAAEGRISNLEQALEERDARIRELELLLNEELKPSKGLHSN